MPGTQYSYDSCTTLQLSWVCPRGRSGNGTGRATTDGDTRWTGPWVWVRRRLRRLAPWLIPRRRPRDCCNFHRPICVGRSKSRSVWYKTLRPADIDDGQLQDFFLSAVLAEGLDGRTEDAVYALVAPGGGIELAESDAEWRYQEARLWPVPGGRPPSGSGRTGSGNRRRLQMATRLPTDLRVMCTEGGGGCHLWRRGVLTP
jgi:hypothetical protein